jgi:hypothetical protein
MTEPDEKPSRPWHVFATYLAAVLGIFATTGVAIEILRSAYPDVPETALVRTLPGLLAGSLAASAGLLLTLLLIVRRLDPARLRLLPGRETGPSLAVMALGLLALGQALDSVTALLGLGEGGNLLRTQGDAAVVLADAEDVVALAGAALHAALDLAGLPAGHSDLGHDESQRAPGAGDGGNPRIGPAVLRGDGDAVGRQVAHRELGRPLGVVDLHGHEGQVEVARQPLCLVQVHGGRTGGEGIVRARHRDALAVDGVHLLGPGVDQRDGVAGSREERAQVAADGASADEQNLLAHGGLLRSWGGRIIARSGAATRARPAPTSSSARAGASWPAPGPRGR